MNSNTRVSSRQYLLDKTGLMMSAICSAHCILVPVFLSVSTYGGLAFLTEPLLENIILVLSAIIGIGSLLPAYLRHHRQLTKIPVAICLLLLGFTLIVLGRSSDHYEVVLTSSGAAVVALSHFVNLRLCRKCLNAK